MANKDSSADVRFISILIGVVCIAVVLVYQAMGTGASTVHIPSQILALEPGQDLKRIRVGGKVANQQIDYVTSPRMELKFGVEDPSNPNGAVPVVYYGLRPDMFQVGRDVIIDGNYEGGVLTATNLVSQCPSKYEPPDPKKIAAMRSEKMAP